MTLACTSWQAAVAETPPQALPLQTALKSALVQDADGFKSAYSLRILQEEKAKGSDWKKLVQEGHKNMTKMFGNYEMGQFEYSFQGTGQSGSVSCSFKGKKAFALKVVHEKTGWKLNER